MLNGRIDDVGADGDTFVVGLIDDALLQAAADAQDIGVAAWATLYATCGRARLQALPRLAIRTGLPLEAALGRSDEVRADRIVRVRQGAVGRVELFQAGNDLVFTDLESNSLVSHHAFLRLSRLKTRDGAFICTWPPPACAGATPSASIVINPFETFVSQVMASA